MLKIVDVCMLIWLPFPESAFLIRISCRKVLLLSIPGVGGVGVVMVNVGLDPRPTPEPVAVFPSSKSTASC